MDASSSRPGRREHESSSSSSAYGSHVYPSDRRRRSIDRPSDHIQDRPGPPGPGPGPVTASSSSSSSSSRSPKRSRGEGSEAPSQSQQRHASSAIAVSPSASPTSSSRPPPAASREGVPGRRSSSSAVAADAMDHRYYQQQPGLRQYAGQSSRVPAGSSLYGSGAQGQQLGPFPHHDYSHMVLPPPHTPQLSTSSPGVMVAAGPSSAGGSPMRPLGRPATPELPIKLTPITGRVSRAKKGVPVHTCDLCRPPKVRA